jgi:hypothetical protein
MRNHNDCYAKGALQFQNQSMLAAMIGSNNRGAFFSCRR